MLAYDGSDYAGWQIQEKPDPPPTIQGAVETALFVLLRQKVRVFGAGRTDAGVHAFGQVAHCDVPDKIPDWRKSLNSVLPADIRVVEASEVAADFHARKSAIAKTYVYQFWQQREFVPPLLRKQVWAAGALDVREIVSGLHCLEGEHDFASFQNAGTEVKSTIRTITRITLAESICEGYGAWPPMLRMSVTGTGFLKQMARNIAGLLAAIGMRKLKWRDLAGIFAARNRAVLPVATAPAMGLILSSVDYGERR